MQDETEAGPCFLYKMSLEVGSCWRLIIGMEDG